VVPQGWVPFTAVRGRQREGAGSRNKPPPCCEKRMLSGWLCLGSVICRKDSEGEPESQDSASFP
jgi:hypothetical protein